MLLYMCVLYMRFAGIRLRIAEVELEGKAEVEVATEVKTGAGMEGGALARHAVA